MRDLETMTTSEEIIIALSNLGAISEDKAAEKELLNNSVRLKGTNIVVEIQNLIVSGYVKETDGKKFYLTKAGLFRALSKFS